MMRAIHTEQEYQAALVAVRGLWGSTDPDAVAEMEAWAILIEDYERRSVTPDAGIDPIEVIKADMDMTGHTRGDLGAIIGATRVSDILEKRRRLTVKMIRDISEQWQIPARLLLGDYAITPAKPHKAAA